MTKDLKKLIELAKETKSNPVKWENPRKRNSIEEFIKSFNIVSGPKQFDPVLMELLYNAWAQQPVAADIFHTHMKKLIKTRGISKIYLIDEKVMKVDWEEFNKRLYPMLLKRRELNVEKEKKKSKKSTKSQRSG